MVKKKLVSFLLACGLVVSSIPIGSVHAANTAADVISIATSQIGYHEKASNSNLDDFTANSGSGNYTKYSRDLGTANGVAWCAIFVTWVMQSAGVSRGEYPNADSWSSWGSVTKDFFNNRGRWRDRGTYTPKPGDYIALGTLSHCGIVEKVENGKVYTIEGNWNDQVARNSYALTSTEIKGYGIINYASDTTTAVDNSNPGSPYPIPTGILKIGNSGDGVKWIQKFANDVMKAGISVDGIYGAQTANAVKTFQQNNGLTVDEIAGPQTINKMLEVWRAQTADKTAPVINNVKITHQDAVSYTVECDVTDNVGVTRVSYPTWTTKVVNGTEQDDIKWADGTLTNGHSKFTVYISDHNNETGPYRTHIYAYDAVGNKTVYAVPDITIDNVAPVISNIKVSSVDAAGYTVECDVTDNVGVVRVAYPSWTTRVVNGTDLDDIKWADGTLINGHSVFRVNISDHGNEYGKYRTHIYAYDASGNYVCCPVPDVEVLPAGAQTTATTAQNTTTNAVVTTQSSSVTETTTQSAATTQAVSTETSTSVTTQTGAATTATTQPATEATTATTQTTTTATTQATTAATTQATTATATTQATTTATTQATTATATTQATTAATTQATTTATTATTQATTVATTQATTSVPLEKVTGVTVTNKKTRKVVVSWKKQSAAARYHVQYSTSSSFKKATMKSTTYYKKTLTKMTKRKTYYFRVRAVADDGTVGTWSKKVKVKITK